MSSKIIIGIFDSIPLWVMVVPILTCSVILIAVVIERMIFYRRIDMDYRMVINHVVEKLSPKKPKIDEIIMHLAGYSGVLIDMIAAIIKQKDTSRDINITIRDISEKSIISIEKFGGIVSTIATVAPMLGLLGTVTGMMKSFSGLSQYGATAQELLAQGITEALVTTALGLLVAIPSIIFYNFMVTKIEYYIKEVEYIANALSETLS